MQPVRGDHVAWFGGDEPACRFKALPVLLQRVDTLVSELALQSLRAFPTTTVEDEAALGGTDKRTSAAVAYRLGVKRRLQTFVGQLRFREYNF